MSFPPAAVVPRELTASFAGIPVNQPVPEWTTLITSQFCTAVFAHSGEYVVFVDFGNNVEDRLGHVKYLISVWCFGSLNAVVLSQNLGFLPCASGCWGYGCLHSPLPLRAQVLTLVFLGFFITTVRIPAIFFSVLSSSKLYMVLLA